uniref:Oxidoreductase FAD/NAD(P)-binding domain-containing protein n=1 Tax=Brassica oleracea var. oleracea TaxID=109376 RepID=A0A0D3AJQ4_BRAOL
MQKEGFLSTWTNSFVGPWDPSQGLYNPDEQINLWLFLPGRHSSISDTAQAAVSKLRDVIFGFAFVKVARAILENPTDKTKVHLIYANGTYDDVLLRVQRCTSFKIYYPPETWDGGVGFVSKDMIQAHCPAPASDIQVIPYPLFFLILNIPDHHFF